MSLVSVDILHQVFNFFVSSDQVVDGESLRVATLVCKQWKSVLDSRSLWGTPVGAKEGNGRDDDNDSACSHSRTVYRSLQIKEVSSGEYNSSPEGETSLQESLIGFTNLKCYGSNFHELYFFVRERATGSNLLLSISRNGQKKPSLIQSVYANHFELKEEFLLRDHRNDDATENYTGTPSHCFPIGISIWKGRVVRWYRSGTETEARSTIERISTKRDFLFHQRLGFTNCSIVHHLIDLENNSSRDTGNNEGFRTDGRQHIVDWVSDARAISFDIFEPLFLPYFG